MKTMTQLPAAEMRDAEQEYAVSIQRRQDRDGNPKAGLLSLTRQMETEDEDQFDVDCTMLDCLAYKATEGVFAWRADLVWTELEMPPGNAILTSGTFFTFSQVFCCYIRHR